MNPARERQSEKVMSEYQLFDPTSPVHGRDDEYGPGNEH